MINNEIVLSGVSPQAVVLNDKVSIDILIAQAAEYAKQAELALKATEEMFVGYVFYWPQLMPGFVKANGATVRRADYPRLVAYADKYNLWTDNPAAEPWKFGRGDSVNTMVLPDYRNRVIQGGDIACAKQAGLPNITGAFRGLDGVASTYAQEGAFYADDYDNYAITSRKTEKLYARKTLLDASRSNPIYGNSSTVQSPAIVLLPQIRF